ncbi:hypothetical protein [Carboxylicivirga sp. N1Y90]|uniref:hypothetical protein n=1 Tax=Carboxylicivirga fragile TaxID=3417571 RepID=UPI003D34D8F1|nr:hypothetical protein [Marinilabiliaceae bacterium N1Y90]
MRNSFEKEMDKIRLLIFGVTGSPDIKERIAPLYTEERLAKGVDLYQTLKQTATQQSIEMNESKGATFDFNSTKDELHDVFVKARKAIRFFYRNDLKTQESLFIDKVIPANYPEWRALVGDTVGQINRTDGLPAKLAIFKVDTEDMGAKLSLLDEQSSKAEKEDGEAQQITVKKTELFGELRSYCYELRECLDLFYDGDDRQKLEEVGITVK